MAMYRFADCSVCSRNGMPVLFLVNSHRLFYKNAPQEIKPSTQSRHKQTLSKENSRLFVKF